MTEKWLICVDPDSNQIYTLNLTTNEVVIETDVPEAYRKRSTECIKDLNNLLKLNSSSWLTENKGALRYRRRKIPSYLLHKISTNNPTYLCQSTLSLAFAEKNSISLTVHLTEYEKTFVEQGVKDPPKTTDIEAGLVTG